MKKSYNLMGGGNFACLLALIWLLFNQSAAFAQMNPGLSTPPSGAADPDAYSITGDFEKVEPGLGSVHLYQRTMPETDGQVYWHVEGALTIGGTPAAMYPDGSLDAKEVAELKIEWDSVATGLLQLRRFNPESKGESMVLAELVVGLKWYNFCKPYVYCYGYQNDQNTRVTNSLFLCPNTSTTCPMDEHRYTFEYKPKCGSATWTVDYYTANGQTYTETWLGSGPIALEMFSTVPYYPYQTAAGAYTTANDTVTANLGLHLYQGVGSYCSSSPYFGSYLPPAPSGFGNPIFNLGLAGAPIVRAHIQVEGDDCGAWGKCGKKSTGVDVYYGMYQPEWLTLHNNPSNYNQLINGGQNVCRNQIYTAECGGADNHATSYIWSTSAGTISGTGQTATLNLNGVSPNTRSVTVSVRAVNANAPCGGTSSALVGTYLFPVTATPAAITMAGPRPICPGIFRTLTVSPVPGAVSYDWVLTGPGAAGAMVRVSGSDRQANVANTPSNSLLVQFNATGNATATARANSSCGLPSLSASADFYIGGASSVTLDADPRTEFADYFNYLWHPITNGQFNQNAPLVVTAPQLGVAYRFVLRAVWLFADTDPGQYNTSRLTSPPSSAGPVSALHPTGTSQYAAISDPSQGAGSAYISILDNSVAFLDVDLIANGSCIPGVAPTVEHYHLERPTHGGYWRAAPATAATMTVYPNPTTGKVALDTHLLTASCQQVQVFNAQGTLMMTVQGTDERPVNELDMSALAPGMYLLRAGAGANVLSQRVIKQ